jgi:hypothetical protein
VDASAEDTASLFFTHWYCENGSPLNIVSDHDKVFVSAFWKALHALTGVSLKMSSLCHPETDGASEWTNKTVNQAIRYYVQRNQKGWVRALLQIRFEMMNMVNASTGFSGFQLRMGWSVRLIPPLVPDRLLEGLRGLETTKETKALLDCMKLDSEEAKDCLLYAKTVQAHPPHK